MPQTILPFQLAAERSETRTTARAGVLPLVELCVATGLMREADRHVGLRRAGQGYTDGQFVLSLVLLNVLGGESMSDLDVLEADAGLCDIVREAERVGRREESRRAFDARFRGGRHRTLPSDTSVSRYLESFHDAAAEDEREPGAAYIPPPSAALEGLAKVNARMLAVMQEQRPSAVATLDIDATLLESHKREALFCYKGFSGYQPFNVYWAEQDVIVRSEFRDGNVPAGFQQTRVLQEALHHLPKGVQTVRLRSDSAGYEAELLRYCAEGKSKRFGAIEFTVSADITKPLRAAVAELSDEDWKPLPQYLQGEPFPSDHQWAEVCYVPNSLSTMKNGPTYRFVVMREPLRQLTLPGVEAEDDKELPFPVVEEADGRRFKLSAIVTNRHDIPGEELIRWHRERCGAAEAAHAVMKHDLAGGRVPSGKFGANAAWWAIMILAANLVAILKHAVLRGRWAKARLKALRFGFFHVVGRLTTHARVTTCRVAEPFVALFALARVRVAELARGPSP